MLLINFICLFYLMVLISCDTISRSAANIDSFYVSDQFNVQQDVSDPVSQKPRRLPRLRKQKKPWIYRVPLNNYQSTAALENILENIKYNNMKQIASSPLGSTGMVFVVTQPGYATGESESSNTRPNILHKENKFSDKMDAEDTTTEDEKDEMILLDDLRREGKNKRRTNNEEKHAFKVEHKKETEVKKFGFKDIFKFLRPNKENISAQHVKNKQELLKEVPVLPKDEVKVVKHDKSGSNLHLRKVASEGSARNVSEKIQRSRSNKEKKENIRHQRRVDMKESEDNRKWLPKFMKREPHLQEFDSTVYEKLSEKLAYKDFVNGFKYYLNFEKDMAKSNFSDMVRYQAHMHHNVNDIGKFILEKIPQVPTTISFESKSSSDQPSQDYEDTDNPLQIMPSTYKTKQPNENADTDYGINLEKYDDTETSTDPNTPDAFNLLKKRLIDFRRPFWLSKSNSYSDSKTRSPRVRRHGIRFDKTQFPNSLKTERALLKEHTKNVGFAKVTLVEASKSKKPFKSLFSMFKKHHSKRDIQREARSSFLNKLRDFFSKRRTTEFKCKADDYSTGSYDLQSHLYDIMNEEGLLSVEERLKEQSTQRQTNQLLLDDYTTDPLSVTMTTLSTHFRIDTDIPFELTTPMVSDPGLRKRLHELQRDHDYLSSKLESALNSVSASGPSMQPLGLDDPEVAVNKPHQWPSKVSSSTLPTRHHENSKSHDDENEKELVNKARQWSNKVTSSTLPNRHHENSKEHDDEKDLGRSSYGKTEQLTSPWQDADAITRPMVQDTPKSLGINYLELKDIQKDYHSPKPTQITEIIFNKQLKDTAQAWKSIEKDIINNNLKGHYSLKKIMWHNKNDPGFTHIQVQFRNNLNDLFQTEKTNGVKLNNKQKVHHMSNIGQQKDSELIKQVISTISNSNPEFKNKELYSATSETSDIINKANPANHFNIKPGMFNQLDLDEMAFRITGWSDRLNNDFTTDTMTLNAEKRLEFDKTDKSIKDVFEHWSVTPAILEVKTSKMPVTIGKISEFYKEGNIMTDVKYRATPASDTHNTDVRNRLSIKEFINEPAPEKKVLNHVEGDSHYYVSYDEVLSDNFLNKQSATAANNTEEKVKIEENHDDYLKSTDKMSPADKKLLLTTHSPKKAANKVKNAKTTPTTRKLEGESSLYTRPEKLTQLKGEYKNKTTGGDWKQKQSGPHDIHLEVTSPNNLKETKFRQENVDFGITLTSDISGSQSSMLDRFILEFPKYTTIIQADVGTLVKEWFEKHPDLVHNTNKVLNKGKSADELSDMSNNGKWFDKHNKKNKNMNVTTMAMKKPKLVITEIPKFDLKDIPKFDLTGVPIFSTSEIPKFDLKDILKIDVKGTSKFSIKDMLGEEKNTVSLKPETANKGSVGKNRPEVKKGDTNRDEKMETLDLGKLVKDWLDSFDPDLAKTTSMTPKSLKTSTKITDNKAGISKDKVHVVKHMAFNVKDLPHVNNNYGKTSIRASILNANDEGVPELDKVYDYMKNTFPNDEPTTVSENYRYLFESVPKYELVKTHEYGPQLSSPENFGETIFSDHLKTAPKKSDKEKSETYSIINSKEKEQESLPNNLQIVKTFNIIYTAKGEVPSNQSLNNFEAIFHKYSNLRKRKLRKLLSTPLKTPTRSKPPRRKRLTGNSENSKIHEVCSNVTLGGAEMVDKRAKNKRQTNEKHVVKNVAALEVLMDLMKTNDEVQQTSIEKPKLTSPESTNSVQVHLAFPGNTKRSPKKRFRKIFTARLFSPVDMEYQINSYDDTLETRMTSVIPPGMYLLVDDNSTSPRGNIILERIPNDLSRILPRQNLAANPDVENKKVEQSTQCDKFSKVTLSKEFVSAVNEHLVQLYEAYKKDATNMDETTRQFNKAALGNDFMTVNIERSAELQQTANDAKLNLHKRETKKGRKAIENGEHEMAFEMNAVNDAIMEGLVSEMNSLVEYMNQHCTEIQTYFRNNPSGGRKLRDTLRNVNKLVNKYSKRASARKSYFCKSFRKIVSKRQTEFVDDPNKYVPSKLINYVKHLASDICNATECKMHFNEQLYDGRSNLVDVVDKCVSGVESRNERSVTKNDNNEYSLDRVRVNIICQTEASTTTPQQSNQMAVHWLVDNVSEDSLSKKQWSLKNFLRPNKHMNKSKEPMSSRSWKREVGSIDHPLNADTGGSFWSNYMHKFQKTSHSEKLHTSGESSVTMNNNEKGITPTKQISATAEDSTENVRNICSNPNIEITTLTGNPQFVNATTNNTVEKNVVQTTIEPNNIVKNLQQKTTNTNKTNEYLSGKKERKIKSKHKEKHTKITNTPKSMAIKGKSRVTVDKINPVYNEGDDIHSTSAQHTVANTISKSTQSNSVNANKDEDVKEVKINNKSTFALKQLFKKIPGYIDDKEKYTNSDVATEPLSITAITIDSTTTSITPNLLRNVINQISKTGDKTFKHWYKDNIVKISGNDNAEEAKEPNKLSTESVTDVFIKPIAGEDGDRMKNLLLSILRYETKRISSDSIF